jgi:hypothetical protein
MLSIQTTDMRSTLTLDDDVMAKLQKEMRRRGVSFKEIVNETLRIGLHSLRDIDEAKPFKVQARELGIIEGLNYDNIGELVEQIEGPFNH